MGEPSREGGPAGSWGLLGPPCHWAAWGHSSFSRAHLLEGPEPKDSRRFQGLGCCPTCPTPLAPKITGGVTWTVWCPFPSLHLPASSRKPPSTLSPWDPASLSSVLPTEGHPGEGSPSLSWGGSLGYQLSTGPASAELWTPGTHNMLTTPFLPQMAVILEGGVRAQGHRYGAPQMGRWRAPSILDKNSHAGAKPDSESAQAAPAQ